MVHAITGEVVDRARHLLDQHEHVTARDALHASVVLTHGLDGIVSYDRDFDVFAGVARQEP